MLKYDNEIEVLNKFYLHNILKYSSHCCAKFPWHLIFIFRFLKIKGQREMSSNIKMKMVSLRVLLVIESDVMTACNFGGKWVHTARVLPPGTVLGTVCAF